MKEVFEKVLLIIFVTSVYSKYVDQKLAQNTFAKNEQTLVINF